MESEAEVDNRRDMRVARVLASLISVVLIGLGLWSILSGTYSGHTSKLGGADIFLEGRPAVLGGCMYIALGLFPLAFWFKLQRHAAWWASACMVAFLGFLLAMLYS